MRRKIIDIDLDKCTGCGLCIPDCPEGALQLIDGKARLISDLFCDGLGACIGSCPQNAINVLEREAEPYDERRVMANIVPQGELVIRAHIEHLKGHGETKLYNQAVEYLKEKNINIPTHDDSQKNKTSCSDDACPGSASAAIDRNKNTQHFSDTPVESELRQWPIQLKLLNPEAQYFDNADLLLAADCTAFSYVAFHRDFLAGKILIMFCPKLDPHIDEYTEKLADILNNHTISSITVVRMEVPCCGGVNRVLDEAIKLSGKSIQVNTNIITRDGRIA